MRYLICVTFCSLLCGCLVLPESYYLPVSDVGELERSACGTYGPNSSIIFREDGVSIEFYLRKRRFKNTDVYVDLPTNYQAGNKYLVLTAVIGIEPGNFAVIHNQELKFFVDSADSEKYKFSSFFVYSGEYFKSETFFGSEKSYTGMKFGERLEYIPTERGYVNNYLGNVWLDAHDADSVRFDKIEIEVNDRQIEIGPIDFFKKSGVFYYPMNC